VPATKPGPRGAPRHGNFDRHAGFTNCFTVSCAAFQAGSQSILEKRMPFIPIPPRPITSAELAVIKTALARAPSALPIKELRHPLETLQVLSICPCGCDSVEFVTEEGPRSRPVAEAFGTRPFGGQVGVLVWGTDDRITGLEVYDLSFDDKGIRLPTPESVQSWPVP
jgi:hypothetical protein